MPKHAGWINCHLEIERQNIFSTKELNLKLKIALADSKLPKTNLERDEKLSKRNLITIAQLDQTKTLAESYVSFSTNG